jgi:ribosomal protein S18 acetylase RimI-like enzyme
MERLKCSMRAVTDDDRGMLTLIAEETLHPLAEGAGHPERYRCDELVDLLERAEVIVAEAGGEVAGFMAVETQGEELHVACVCVGPLFEARGVANQLLDWAEGMGIDRGLTKLTAYVPAGDHPSRHLYEGHAFAATPPDDDEMIALVKRLPSVES